MSEPMETPVTPSAPDANRDEEHLRLLSIFQYIVGGIHGLFSLFPLIHVFLGVMFMVAPCHSNDCPPPAFGALFVIMGGLFILFGETLAISQIVLGKFLSKRKHHTACLVLAALECLCMPFGTLLGVFTLVVLLRPSVKQMFESPRHTAIIR